jgi:hypothetical protein
MAGLRHDAAWCRTKAKSEILRRQIGLWTPEEREAQAKRDQVKAEAEAKKSAKGTPLFEEE